MNRSRLGITAFAAAAVMLWTSSAFAEREVVRKYISEVGSDSEEIKEIMTVKEYRAYTGRAKLLITVNGSDGAVKERLCEEEIDLEGRGTEVLFPEIPMPADNNTYLHINILSVPDGTPIIDEIIF